MIKKILQAGYEWPRALKRTENPTLFMTLLVKNEDDIIEQNILFHKSMGVDGFIVTDNNSTDRTRKILEEYKQRGWIMKIIDEPHEGFDQKVWVDRMIMIAKNKYHADWVINADADELWYSPTNDLKTELRETHATVVKCELRNMYPNEQQPFFEWDKRIEPMPNPEGYGFPRYSPFGFQGKKVIHRTAGYIQISSGNHKVAMFPHIKTNSAEIRVYHYNFRGKDRFISKMANGGRQLVECPGKSVGKHVGGHWKYFYHLYLQGKLAEEYDNLLAKHRYDELLEDGIITTDTTISDYFKLLLATNQSAPH